MNEELYKLFQTIQQAEQVLGQVKGGLYSTFAQLADQTENLDARTQAHLADEFLCHTYEAFRRLRYSLQDQVQRESGDDAA